MQIIPVQAVPNQIFSTLLGDQSCEITLSTRAFGLYFDLSVNNTNFRNGVVCQDRNLLIRYPSLGFSGDFWFLDTQGTSDPVYTGLGTRFLFEYWSEADLQARGLV
jgi:hypothetical protein